MKPLPILARMSLSDADASRTLARMTEGPAARPEGGDRVGQDQGNDAGRSVVASGQSIASLKVNIHRAMKKLRLNLRQGSSPNDRIADRHADRPARGGRAPGAAAARAGAARPDRRWRRSRWSRGWRSRCWATCRAHCVSAMPGAKRCSRWRWRRCWRPECWRSSPPSSCRSRAGRDAGSPRRSRSSPCGCCSAVLAVTPISSRRGGAEWELGESMHCLLVHPRHQRGCSLRCSSGGWHARSRSTRCRSRFSAGSGSPRSARFVLQFFHPFAVTFIDLAVHLVAILIVVGVSRTCQPAHARAPRNL